MSTELPLGRDDRAVLLLPCPFCGGEAELTTEQQGAEVWIWDVYCTGCGVENTGFSEERTAIAAWNRRAQKATP